MWSYHLTHPQLETAQSQSGYCIQHSFLPPSVFSVNIPTTNILYYIMGVGKKKKKEHFKITWLTNQRDRERILFFILPLSLVQKGRRQIPIWPGPGS